MIVSLPVQVLAFRAGSRFEDVNQKGLVHHVRNFVGRDSEQFLGVPLLWSTAAIGANLVSWVEDVPVLAGLLVW